MAPTHPQQRVTPTTLLTPTTLPPTTRVGLSRARAAQVNSTPQPARAILLCIAAMLVLAAGALAQVSVQADDSEPLPSPNLSEAVLRLLDAPYLTAAERADLRVFHGVALPDDLADPSRRAQDALVRGRLDNPALSDEAVAPELRAEAMLRRGELIEALDLLADLDSVRAVRLRAETLERVGRFDDAAKALAPLVDRLKHEQLTSAADLTDAVLALNVRLRVQGQEQAQGGDFRTLMQLLARARDEMDRLYWPALLAEAELLYERDNAKEATQAIVQLLALNGSCADAWALFGRMTVDQFDFDRTERVAARLDRLAGIEPGSATHGPAGALLLVRARLRQNDPADAQRLLDTVLEKFPRHREALALAAAVAAEAYDWDEVDRRLSAFDALSPGSPEALLEAGKVASENRQYEHAATYLQRAADLAPFRSEPVIELGLLQMQSGHDLEARDALRRAVALDPFNKRADNSLTLIEQLLSYETVRSEHFIVRYKPGLDGVLAPEMLEPLERIHKRVCGKPGGKGENGGVKGGMGFEPAVPTVIELMPDHRWFSVRITGMPKIHTMAACTGPVIAMESPRDAPGHLAGEYDWPRVLQHEYTHTVTLARTHNRIPHWFTEAAAVSMEDAPRDYTTCQLLASALSRDSLFDLDQINVAFVRPEKPTDRAQAYAQGHWMYEYIVERWGGGAPLEMMDLYADGVREADAMERVLGIGPDEFLGAFKEWARGQVVSWGLVPRAGVPTLIGLRLSLIEDRAQRKRITERIAVHHDAEAVSNLPEPTPERVRAWLKRYPDHPDVLRLAVGLALADGGGAVDESSIGLLERYARACPVDPMPHRVLARYYLDASEPAAAIEHLEYLDAREQHAPTYAEALVRQYAAIGDLDGAAAKAERAVRIAPFNPRVRELAATVALRRKDYAAARRHLLALSQIEPDRAIHRKRLEALDRLESSPD